MSVKKTAALVLAFLLFISVLASAQTNTYEEFFGEFIKRRAKRLEEDASEFERLLDSWSNGNISQSTVVAELEEMEARADSYFEDVLSLPAPEGKFDRYKQSIYIFVTWSNIIGIFTEGMSDLDMSKLDAASTLSDYFEKKVNQFENRVINTE